MNTISQNQQQDESKARQRFLRHSSPECAWLGVNTFAAVAQQQRPEARTARVVRLDLRASPSAQQFHDH